MGDGEAWDDSTSTVYAANSFAYFRETKQGDLAGRVPIAKDQRYKLVMINYNENAD